MKSTLETSYPASTTTELPRLPQGMQSPPPVEFKAVEIEAPARAGNIPDRELISAQTPKLPAALGDIRMVKSVPELESALSKPETITPQAEKFTPLKAEALGDPHQEISLLKERITQLESQTVSGLTKRVTGNIKEFFDKPFFKQENSELLQASEKAGQLIAGMVERVNSSIDRVEEMKTEATELLSLITIVNGKIDLKKTETEAYLLKKNGSKETPTPQKEEPENRDTSKEKPELVSEEPKAAEAISTIEKLDVVTKDTKETPSEVVKKDESKDQESTPKTEQAAVNSSLETIKHESSLSVHDQYQKAAEALQNPETKAQIEKLSSFLEKNTLSNQVMANFLNKKFPEIGEQMFKLYENPSIQNFIEDLDLLGEELGLDLEEREIILQEKLESFSDQLDSSSEITGENSRISRVENSFAQIKRKNSPEQREAMMDSFSESTSHNLSPAMEAKLLHDEYSRLLYTNPEAASLSNSEPYYNGGKTKGRFEYSGNEKPGFLNSAIQNQVDHLTIANALAQAESSMGEDKLANFQTDIAHRFGLSNVTINRTGNDGQPIKELKPGLTREVKINNHNGITTVQINFKESSLEINPAEADRGSISSNFNYEI